MQEEAEGRRLRGRSDQIPREYKVNDTIAGDVSDLGFVLQGGMYNHVIAALRALGLADDLATAAFRLHVLNCVYPLVPDELPAFWRWQARCLGLDPDRHSANAGYLAQSTSIPGVRAENRATTYYIEYSAIPLADTRNAATGLCTDPRAGQVDVMIASELIEARGRRPDRLHFLLIERR